MSRLNQPLTVASLFSGIGGIEFGLHQSGHKTVLFCEIEAAAQAVLRSQFQDVQLESDVTKIKTLPECDLVAAGFPCQDLSQAGQKAGIDGKNSGLVENLFRLLNKPKSKRPSWILIENVPNMLRLDGGSAMRYLVDSLEALGYHWAYRIVDARSFGLPQRRPRVILLASRTADPRSVLFADDEGAPAREERPTIIDERFHYGFYWTEGIRGVGWAREAVPPIKGGSTVGIPSPPAVWIPRQDYFGTPDIRDAERLQGFPADWTLPALEAGFKKGVRWKLVGNAVCTEVARWVGERLLSPGEFDEPLIPVPIGRAWPSAAWGSNGSAFVANISTSPIRYKNPALSRFLKYPLQCLSIKATAGFLNRTADDNCSVVYAERFLSSLRQHLQTTQEMVG